MLNINNAFEHADPNCEKCSGTGFVSDIHGFPYPPRVCSCTAENHHPIELPTEEPELSVFKKNLDNEFRHARQEGKSPNEAIHFSIRMLARIYQAPLEEVGTARQRRHLLRIYSAIALTISAILSPLFFRWLYVRGPVWLREPGVLAACSLLWIFGVVAANTVICMFGEADKGD